MRSHCVCVAHASLVYRRTRNSVSLQEPARKEMATKAVPTDMDSLYGLGAPMQWSLVLRDLHHCGLCDRNRKEADERAVDTADEAATYTLIFAPSHLCAFSSCFTIFMSFLLSVPLAFAPSPLSDASQTSRRHRTRQR